MIMDKPDTVDLPRFVTLCSHFSSMAAAPGMIAPRAASPIEDGEGKLLPNGVSDQKVVKINVSGWLLYDIR